MPPTPPLWETDARWIETGGPAAGNQLSMRQPGRRPKRQTLSGISSMETLPPKARAKCRTHMHEEEL